MTLSPHELAESIQREAHGDAGLAAIREYLGNMELTDRMGFLADNLVTRPIYHAAAVLRVGSDVEQFNVLQGDVVRSSAAFFLGNRAPEQTYVVATSSCDLPPGREATALLLPVRANRRQDYPSDRALKAALRKATLFEHTRTFYLPALPDDPSDVLFNTAHLDKLHTCDNAGANLAERRASLTLLGWRLFGVLARELLVREAADEALMRTEVSEET